MNFILAAIHWAPNPEIIRILGIPLRYYGLLWAVGLFLGYLVVRREFRDRKIPEDALLPLFSFCFFGILLGARLGHCLFYQPDYFLPRPIEMFLPIRHLPHGGWEFTGYAGLASHGGALGLAAALALYVRRTKLNYMDLLDMIAVATPVTACFIRLANLMNSEIIGRPADLPWAFVFEREDTLPRHPAQLYEALAYFCLFLILLFLYRTRRHKVHRGFFFGLCLASIFTFRFFIEFLKENQVPFEDGLSLNMGQWLSLPFVLTGLACLFCGKRLDRST